MGHKINIPLTERQKIKSELKFGDFAEIARRSGKSVSTVKRWFRGEGNAFEVPEAINSMLQSRAKTLKNFERTLKEIDNTS